MKRIELVGRSYRIYTKGKSALKYVGSAGREDRNPKIAVAAAATVPAMENGKTYLLVHYIYDVDKVN